MTDLMPEKLTYVEIFCMKDLWASQDIYSEKYDKEA